ncbi:unnamed protein product [Spirodela intermedia]|uniref:Uncharacterized protein n=1 Tax=Spirodela intermedia TaxID=51605 RepID=A0ABN7EBM4_SPIIN|nr:unnamed protein product [Spirodela intermedia]
MGQGLCWSDVARNAGLQRCGKSCRLRWINYLRPDLKRGAFSPLRKSLSSTCIRLWSQIAARLPGRTDNEVKNFWNSTIKKRLKTTSSSAPSPPPPASALPAVTQVPGRCNPPPPPGYFVAPPLPSQAGLQGDGREFLRRRMRMGEWSLGDLMEDVASFPFIDF